ncbi:MAG: hypothetical protein II579_01030 [Treponema sp.]|jgi:hypothetical protein|nr:hypothetical protein [Treponema sp.]
MAKIYALLTKFTWGLYIFASILGLAKSWVKPHWVIIGAIILLFLTFPALAITDLTEQVENLKKLVEKSSKRSSNGEKASEKTDSSDVWICTKCGATNPVGTMLCGKCGQ